jgi:hypothetical protein
VRPPVPIGQDQASALSFTLEHGAEIYAAGAGGYGRKLRRTASVPLALRLVTKGPAAAPNNQRNTRTVIPLGYTRRKQGLAFPSVTGAPNASSS